MLWLPRLSDDRRQKWQTFGGNRRGFASLLVLLCLLVLSLGAELYANSKPILISYEGAWYLPFWYVYPETTFGGDFATEADYQDPFIRDKITTAGNRTFYPLI